MFIDRPYFRKNKIMQWEGSDSEENYLEIQPSGQLNYTKDAFWYKYNSDGFRSDEFTDHSDLRVVFSGCSYTEGSGLPLEEVWVSLVHNKIAASLNNQNKKIPLWNLGILGTGLDSHSRVLYNYADQLKPEYVFLLSGALSRREICYNDIRLFNWLPATNDKLEQKLGISLGKLFSSEWYALQQLNRNLMILDLLADKHNSKVFIFDLEDTTLEKDLLYSNFKHIKRCLIRPKDYIKTDRPAFARDCMHSGPDWQESIAELVWKAIRHLF